MPFLYNDPTFILLIPAIGLALWAQMRVSSTFSRFNQVQAASGMTGSRVARALLDAAGLGDVVLEKVQGKLTDHYDPRSRKLRLSEGVAENRSVAALGIAAHEVGHALQHQAGYAAFRIRQSIVPVANIGSTLAFPIFIMGLIFATPKLMDIGILLFLGAVAFQLVTLPVEFNASSRALGLLQSRGFLVEAEVGQARKVLNAAALTYVAALAVSLVHLLRLLLLRGSRD